MTSEDAVSVDNSLTIECPVCGGLGWFREVVYYLMDDDEEKEQEEQYPCPDCRMTGRVEVLELLANE